MKLKGNRIVFPCQFIYSFIYALNMKKLTNFSPLLFLYVKSWLQICSKRTKATLSPKYPGKYRGNFFQL